MKKILIFALLCTLILSQRDNTFTTKITPEITITQQEWYFDQTLDHFHPQKEKTLWKQRFCTYSQYFDYNQGAVFVSIGGEAQMKGISEGRGWLVQLAQTYNALVISFEHRFYGVSQPFPQSDTVDSWTTENLKYLTHDQALTDIANFIAQVKLNKFADGSFSVSEMNPFITVGGSYPGALSAWFRQKYPHLTVGSLASSAVVNSIFNFQQYDDQIFLSTQKSGDWCPQNIQNFISNIKTEVEDYTLKVQLFNQFNITISLTNDEFLFYIPDELASFVQYGQRTTLCQIFNTAHYTVQKAQLINYWTQNGGVIPDATPYTQATLNSPKQVSPSDNMRQWLYQYCSKFGWLQTPSQTQGHQMRSSSNNLKFFLKQCITAFGPTYLPQSEEVNGFYGGLNLQATNLIFTNGSEDPWKHASLTKSSDPNILAIVSDCNDCGHGVELDYPESTQPQEVQQTRKTIQDKFSQWIKDYQNQYAFSFVQTKLKSVTA